MTCCAAPAWISVEFTDASALRTSLLSWYDTHRRPLPWRDVSSPYHVWVSEVMLQQTRVDQALPYYTRFVAAFPTVDHLAAADIDTVLRLWEGLGYYARARHLHQAAQIVAAQHGGALPGTYEELLQLPGVGIYTAGAIASIAFGAAVPAVDGNVRRVLARYFALDRPRPAHLRHLALQLIGTERCGDSNQALMELGATVCLPRGPRCAVCPLRAGCKARAAGEPERFPARRVRAPTPHYDVAAGVVRNALGQLLIQRRPERALLGGLWELPGGKRKRGESLQEACARELKEELQVTVEVGDLVMSVRHAYTHFRITLYAFHCTITAGTPLSSAGLPVRWVALDALDAYAFPRANRRILDALVAAERMPMDEGPVQRNRGA